MADIFESKRYKKLLLIVLLPTLFLSFVFALLSCMSGGPCGDTTYLFPIFFVTFGIGMGSWVVVFTRMYNRDLAAIKTNPNP